MSALESMFDGNPFLENIDFRSHREYRTLSNKLDNMERKFLDQLSKSQANEFEELINIFFTLSDLEKKIVFKTATSYAIQFMSEAYNTDSLML